MTHQWKRRPIDIFPKVSTGKKFNSSLNPFQEECAYIEKDRTTCRYEQWEISIRFDSLLSSLFSCFANVVSFLRFTEMRFDETCSDCHFFYMKIMRHTTSFVFLLVFVFSTVVEKGRQLEQCEEMEIGGQRKVLSMTTDRFLQSFFDIQGEPYDQLKIGANVAPPCFSSTKLRYKLTKLKDLKGLSISTDESFRDTSLLEKRLGENPGTALDTLSLYKINE
ncbi:hypothetical protein HZH66_012702 [Vespula vulgaris]|uniref:Uncharacterized protein n=1 Tax=Vespula vulgaris TaxID=7454 RepID=A0A834J9Z6_VESVU|nr:hypothetical protein HZH66_012702 [Vespula vulgaris]